MTRRHFALTRSGYQRITADQFHQLMQRQLSRAFKYADTRFARLAAQKRNEKQAALEAMNGG